MPSSRFTARRSWSRWVGSFGDIVEIAQLASSLTAAHHPGRDHVVVKRGGLTLEYDSVDEFARETTPGDLDSVETLTVYASGKTEDAQKSGWLSVEIDVSPESWLTGAASTSVSGSDRTLVEGIRTQLEERVATGARFPYVNGGSVATFVGVVAFGAFMVLLLAGALKPILFFDHQDPFGLTLVGFMGETIAFVAVFAGPWAVLFPAFEWLDGNGRTRWDRWRRRVLTTVGAVGVAVIAGLVLALLGVS